MQNRDQEHKSWAAAAQEFLTKPYGIALAAVVAFVLCIGIGMGISGMFMGRPADNEADDQPTATVAPTAQPTDADDDDYNADKEKLDLGEYADTVLAETKDAGQDYVDNTLFVGDSNTARYIQYDYISLENGIGVIGMASGHITSLPSVKFKQNSEMITINKAIPIMQPQRVIFGFGTNDLTGNVDSFIETYEKAIKKCYNAYPYFDVIVAAVPPVARVRDYKYISMQNVDKFNVALVKMCKKNGWKFLNTSEVLKDKKSGFCKSGLTNADGLHLSEEGAGVVFDYVRTHAHETEDKRPKPLKKVPARGKTPANLIVKDPVAEATATATLSPEKAVVRFIAGEGGKIQGTLEQQVANAGTCETVVAIPNEGYVFSHWSCSVGRLDPENATLSFTIPGNATQSGDITVQAHFKKLEATAKPTQKPATPEPVETPEPAETPAPVAPDPVPPTDPVTPPTDPVAPPVTPSEPVTPPDPVAPPEPVEPNPPSTDDGWTDA